MNTKNMTNEQLRNYVANQCGYNPPTNKAKPYAIQVCNAGAMPDHLPTSFEDWIKQGNDAIDDPGGNIIPSRVLANHDQYDNDKHPFQ